jgi:ribonuclease G
VTWFRWKKRREEAPAEAAVPEALEREEPARRNTAEPELKPARRRRGSRGGRGRKKKAETVAVEAEQQAAPPARSRRSTPKPVAPKDPRREQPKREGKRSPARKPSATARATFPDVTKEILVSVEVLEQTVAVVEDGQVAEVYLERPSHRSIAGNIYKGVVDNVLPGMEASFVDVGLDRNGFLYVDEIVVPELEGKRHGKRIQELISRGQEVLVQAVKDPMGTKGARLTTEISLPGRFLVYTPFGDGIGVSRRLEDDERERLKDICKELELPEGGLIVRTAAEGASREELAGDLKLLLGLWSTIRGRAARTPAPALVYQEAELPLRIVRDLFIRDFKRVVVDHERTYRKIVAYLKRTSPELAARVERYKGKEPLLEKSGVLEAVNSTLSRRVDLPSGGYLVFDYAEAFTVIDVNTGRFVGGRGKSSNARLEDTITKNNLEAVTEVVRQLRLRDIGGIIVIDFIDMANPKNRQLVEGALNTELGRDRTKTYVVEISPLGLVEMTRQNVTDGPREILTDRCAVCDSTGVVVSAESRAVEVERKLRKHVAGSRAEAFLVELHSDVAAILIGANGERLAELERETGKRFGFKTKKSFRLDRFAVIAEGKAAKIEGLELGTEGGAKTPAQQRSRPAAVEAVVALGEALLADDEGVPESTAAVAEASTDGDQPAAKPKARTRRGSRGGRGRKKKVAVAPDGAAADGAGAERSVKQAEPVEAPEEVQEPGVNGDAPAEEKPKTRTRRGSRGGRGRKKKAETPDGAAADAAAVGAEDSVKQAGPVEAAGEDQEPGVNGDAPDEEKPKKKTRRGTRGGRRRKKKKTGPETAAGPIASGEDAG